MKLFIGHMANMGDLAKDGRVQKNSLASGLHMLAHLLLFLHPFFVYPMSRSSHSIMKGKYGYFMVLIQLEAGRNWDTDETITKGTLLRTQNILSN